MRLHPHFAPHLLDLHVVVRSDTANGNYQSRKVDRRERVVEHEVRSRNSDDFLEDATDAERYDARSLQQSELGRRH